MAILRIILYLSLCLVSGEIINVLPQLPKEEKPSDFTNEFYATWISMATYLADLRVGSVRVVDYDWYMSVLAENSLNVLTWAFIVILFGAVLLLSKVLDDVSRSNIQHQREIREIKQNRERNSVEMRGKIKKLDPWVADLQTQVNWLLEENKRLEQELKNCEAETAILKATVRGMPFAVQELQVKVYELQSVLQYYNATNNITEASSNTEAYAAPEPITNTETSAAPEPITNTEIYAAPEPITNTEICASPEPITNTEAYTAPEPITYNEASLLPAENTNTEAYSVPAATTNIETTMVPTATTNTEAYAVPEASNEANATPEASNTEASGESFSALTATELKQVHEAAKLLFLALGMNKHQD